MNTVINISLSLNPLYNGNRRGVLPTGTYVRLVFLDK